MSDQKALVARAAAGGLDAAASGALAVTSKNNAFTQAAKREGVSDGVFVRFNGNSGEFLVTGADDISLEHGMQLAFLMSEVRIGWLGFDENNRPYRGPEARVADGSHLPALEDFENRPEFLGKSLRWNKVITVPVRLIDGSGPQMVLSTKGDKPTRPGWRLINSYGQLMARHIDDEGKNKIPVVEIGGRSFQIDVEEEQNGRKVKMKATKWGDTYAIKDWISEAELAAIGDEYSDDEADYDADAEHGQSEDQGEGEVIDVQGTEVSEQEPAPAAVSKTVSRPAQSVNKPSAPAAAAGKPALADRFRAGRAGQRA